MDIPYEISPQGQYILTYREHPERDTSGIDYIDEPITEMRVYSGHSAHTVLVLKAFLLHYTFENGSQGYFIHKNHIVAGIWRDDSE